MGGAAGGAAGGLVRAAASRMLPAAAFRPSHAWWVVAGCDLFCAPGRPVDRQCESQDKVRRARLVCSSIGKKFDCPRT